MDFYGNKQDKEVLFRKNGWYIKDSTVVDKHSSHVNGLAAYLFHDCKNNLGWIIHPSEVCDVCKTKPPESILALWILYNMEAGVTFHAPT